MAPKELQIEIDQRYTKLSKSYAIADIYDALAEIITNCDDSYHRLFKNGRRQKDGGDILIKIHQRRKNNPSLVIVYDKAEGMTDVDMEKKLGRIGKRTSEPGDRGFMGRGIKDCTALGEIIVESICDDKYYCCTLTSDDKIKLEDPKNATRDLRNRFGINKKNGTVVTLQCKPKVATHRVDTLARDLPLHYSLRDILAKNSTSRVFISDGNKSIKNRICSPQLYAGGVGEKIFNEKFPLDNYPESECDLQLWKHKKPLEYKDPRLRETGILIKGERAIYQCSLSPYENDEHAKYYSGRLVCKYIDHLMDQFDSCPNQTQENNPMLLVDPSRKHGLNTNHPFTKILNKKIESVLGGLLDNDKKEREQKSENIASEETRKRLNALAREADKIWKKEFDSDDLSDSEERAIETAENKGIYIMPPKFNININEERSLTVYMKESYYDKKRQVRVQSSNEQILGLVQTFSRNSPSPHPKRDGVFYGNIKVVGRKLGKSTITVRPKKDKSATAIGEVVKNRKDGDDHDFSEGVSFEFERPKYQVLERKTKILKIFIKKSQMKERSNVINVSSDNPDDVEVLDGHKCELKPTLHNYAVGEIRVEGRSVTEPQKLVTITATINGNIAKTKVRVIEKRNLSSRFDFQLTSENLGYFRARWADTENKPNLLKISAVHPSIKQYFGKSPDFPGQHDPAGLALIAELITENFCRKILQEEMKTRPGGFKFDNEQPHDVLEKIVVNLQEKIGRFSVKAHKIMQSGAIR